jgi:hypothetical protein
MIKKIKETKQIFVFVFTCIYFANDLDFLIHPNKFYIYSVLCSVVNPCWQSYILRVLYMISRVYPHVT